MDAHRKAEELAAKAQLAISEGNQERGIQDYRNAARFEQQAYRSIPSDKPRTRGIIGLSLVSLLYKGGEWSRARSVAENLLAQDFPEDIKEQIREVRAVIQSQTPDIAIVLLIGFTGVFSAALIVANTLSAAKFLDLGTYWGFTFTLPAGTLLFPLTYVIVDIVAEVYGFARSRALIWTGCLGQLLAILTFYVSGALPEQPWIEGNSVLFRAAPQVFLASIAAVFAGEFCNSLVLSKMKYKMDGERGRSQIWRFVASSVAGQAVDSFVFILLAFPALAEHPSHRWSTAVTIYFYKVAFEIVLSPLSSKLANLVKRIAVLDHIDFPEFTSYNPIPLVRLLRGRVFDR